VPPVYYYSSECRTLDPKWCVVIKQPISVQNVRQPHPFSISQFLRSKSITQQKKCQEDRNKPVASAKFTEIKKKGYSEMYTAIQSDSQSKLYSTAHRTLWNTLGQLRGGTAHIPVKTWLNESTKRIYPYNTGTRTCTVFNSPTTEITSTWVNVWVHSSAEGLPCDLSPYHLRGKVECACMYTPSSR